MLAQSTGAYPAPFTVVLLSFTVTYLNSESSLRLPKMNPISVQKLLWPRNMPCSSALAMSPRSFSSSPLRSIRLGQSSRASRSGVKTEILDVIPPEMPGGPSTLVSRLPLPSTLNLQSPEAVEELVKMSSRRPQRRRTIYPVPRNITMPPSSDPLLEYFASLVMQHGKRHQASRRVAETLNAIHTLTKAPPLPILRQAIEIASPDVKVVSRKMRNKSLMTPRPLTTKQRTGQAIRWIVAICDKRQDFKIEHRMAKEIVAIVNGTSDVIRKKEDTHRLALANRANAAVRI